MYYSSLGNFNIGQPQDRMPQAVVRGFGILKGAAAVVNEKYGLGKWPYAWICICFVVNSR